MPRCFTCSAEVPIASRFCSACGAPVGSDDATLTSLSDAAETIAAPVGGSDDMATIEAVHANSPRPRPASSSSSSRPPSSAAFSLNEGRFLPGRLLAGRYRIIALLGKGGMGEVYRADDLTLGQPVALKFLPEEASRDEGLLERFRNEVRIARRVSHPNVCRVYDVGEVDGNTFFTMEYVDGEDLASLLRRIGRSAAGQGGRYRASTLRRIGCGTREGSTASRSEAGQHHARRARAGRHDRLRPGRTER